MVLSQLAAVCLFRSCTLPHLARRSVTGHTNRSRSDSRHGARTASPGKRCSSSTINNHGTLKLRAQRVARSPTACSTARAESGTVAPCVVRRCLGRPQLRPRIPVDVDSAPFSAIEDLPNTAFSYVAECVWHEHRCNLRGATRPPLGTALRRAQASGSLCVQPCHSVQGSVYTICSSSTLHLTSADAVCPHGLGSEEQSSRIPNGKT
jgi:hypothetical protein